MKPLLIALLVTVPPLAAHAVGPIAPNAGSILQQMQPVMPALPATSGTGLMIEQTDGATLPPSAPFRVQSIQITGHTLFDTPTLQALVNDAQGKTLTLVQLGELAGRITAYYQSHHYPLARAIIPAQTIQDGLVRIQVIEARYGHISLDNRSRVNAALLQSTLSPLQNGQVINQTALDHALLLLSDVAGITVAASLKPGEAVGTSDLQVNTTSGPSVSGQLALDNYGTRYTGRARLGGTVNFYNPLGQGDVLSASALNSGPNMRYGRLAYESLLNGRGTRVGAAYSALDYHLKEPFETAHGTAQVSSLWARHPLLRSRDANLYGQIQYDALTLRDAYSEVIQNDRRVHNWTLSLAGDFRDSLLGGGINSWNLGLTAGQMDFDNAMAQSDDALSAKTQGSFTKWNVNLARLQALGPADTLYFAFSGQWANTNLDASQKMNVGGPYTVRAYDAGAVAGDQGYFASAEYRRELGTAWAGQWQAVVFVDSAQLTVNQNTWGPGDNSATLSGAGLGLNWNGHDQWRVKTYIAAAFGSTPALVASTPSARAWVELSRQF